MGEYAMNKRVKLETKGEEKESRKRDSDFIKKKYDVQIKLFFVFYLAHNCTPIHDAHVK